MTYSYSETTWALRSLEELFFFKLYLTLHKYCIYVYNVWGYISGVEPLEAI